uniref:small monomeric GTPase n=1 Tax=Gasterosteus aculeatus aculeatus TaxID=481459 RepID=A0AAQ4PY64_GASAC
MNDIKLALLGSQGAGKSAVLVRFLTRRFIGEYASNATRAVPQGSGARCIMEEPVDWADGFVVVYNISDRTSFIDAEDILRQIREARVDNCKGEVDVPVCLLGNKRDLCHARQVSEDEGRCLARGSRCHFQEVSAAESYQDIAGLFTQLIRQVMEHLKHRADRRRYSGSKSMAKLINNVFGKRRRSV